MNTLGLIFMISSWIFIITLMLYSYAKILKQDHSLKSSAIENE